MAVRGDRVYLGCFNEGLRVLDISNPALPVEIGHLDDGGYYYQLIMSWPYLYVGSSTWGVRIVDVSDPADMEEVGHYRAAHEAASAIGLNDGYIYVVEQYTGFYSVRFDAPVAVNEQPMDHLPGRFSLAQNYPNPFNPSTTIEFSLPHPEFVSVRIYSISGQEIARLFEGIKPTGVHRVTWDAGGLANGVYVYRVKSASHEMSKKALLMK